MDRRRLGEILVDEAIVSAETVHRALAMQPGTPRRRLGQLLVESGALDPGWLTAALAQQAGCETVDPLALPVDPARLWLVPPDVAERLGAFVACDADGPIAVLADPTAQGVARSLESLLGVTHLRVAAGLPERVNAAIALHYDARGRRERRLLGILGEQRPITVCLTSAELDERRMLARLARGGERAHHDFAMSLAVFALESGAERLRMQAGVVSVTWDGLERKVLQLVGACAVQVAARLKGLTRRDPAGQSPTDVELAVGEHLVPATMHVQSGTVGGTIDLRFQIGATPDDARMAPQVASTWSSLMGRPGLVLLVGEDDPRLQGLLALPHAVQVHDLTDAEAVARAVRAAEGGATVLGRIAGTSAAHGVGQLRSIAPSPLAAAAVLTGALLTARVRRVCATCCWAGEVDAEAGERFGVVPFSAPLAGVGCPSCAYRRYAGSFVTFELTVADEPLRAAMCRGASVSSLGELMHPVADRTLHVDAVAQAIAGFVTVEELKRALPPRPPWAARPAGERHRGLFRAVTDPIPEAQAPGHRPEPPYDPDAAPFVVLIAPGEAAAGALRASLRGRADVMAFPSASAALACTQPIQPWIGVIAQWANGGWHQELIAEWRSLGTHIVLIGPPGDLTQMQEAFAQGADDYAGSIEEVAVRVQRWLGPAARRREASG